jgi:hypothetical protein
VLLGDDPQLIVNSLLDALSQGTTEEELASIVAYAAANRIVQFHTRNELSDWDAVLHTFTYANAVHQGLRRVATQELLRAQSRERKWKKTSAAIMMIVHLKKTTKR